MIVTDERLKTTKELAELLDGLSKIGVEAHVFSAVEPELPVRCIHDAAAEGAAFKADHVIAIGGGSCLDAAKLAALQASLHAAEEQWIELEMLRAELEG